MVGFRISIYNYAVPMYMCTRGIGYCCLSVCRPDLIDYGLLSPGSHIDNLNNAFHVAEQHLGLPQLLDAEGT